MTDTLTRLDTWTLLRAIRGFICRVCGHFNQEIGDCEKCGA